MEPQRRSTKDGLPYKVFFRAWPLEYFDNLVLIRMGYVCGYV